jgi:hypothetical protein
MSQSAKNGVGAREYSSNLSRTPPNVDMMIHRCLTNAHDAEAIMKFWLKNADKWKVLKEQSK